ncbi:hypothetical protein ACFQ4Z_16905 [Oceanobacillus oncorhynchi subsp. oncorhynchi]
MTPIQIGITGATSAVMQNKIIKIGETIAFVAQTNKTGRLNNRPISKLKK